MNKDIFEKEDFWLLAGPFQAVDLKMGEEEEERGRTHSNFFTADI